MNDINMNSVLMQMRALAAQAQGVPKPAVAPTAEFSSLMKSALDQVNATQQNAAASAQAFETGSKEVDLAQVMVSIQKANIAFQATTQVRNKLVSAYQEIMNMPL
jgi:flagellar hook-basal body complex protein FliE